MKQELAEVMEFDLPEEPRKPGLDETRLLYRHEGEDRRIQATRQGLWIAVAAYVSYSFTDWLFIPDVAIYTIIGRCLVGLFALIFLEIQLRIGASADAIDRASAFSVVLAYVMWVVTGQLTSQVQAMSYYMVFGAIFMMSVNLFFSFFFPLALVASATIMAVFLASLWMFASPLESYTMIMEAFCVSCFVFTSYVNWKLNKERFKVFVNALEARYQQNAAMERGKALFRLSNTDSLTGIENRRAIDQRLRTAWDVWTNTGKHFAVFLIDVDFFKRYNDCYGHQQGDRCLVKVAAGLSSAIASDHAALGRYGGEEFIVIAPLEDSEQVTALAEKICASVRDLSLAHSQRRDGTSLVTVSVGASITRGQTGKLEKIIHEADRALYSAKANGRNGIKLFDPNDPQSGDDSENIAAILKIALEQKLVSMVYQPICTVGTGQIDAAESLMRLKMPDGTPVSPAVFIPIAERTGAILQLGRWAIETACRDLLANNLVNVASVNVSPIQLKMPGFAASVATILSETGIAGSRLAFEITEGVEMEMNSDILRCINDLKTLGIRIWLDDFGTGFAGLSWLRLTDFDTVKIDQSFLHDCDSERGRSMLSDIISLVRNRGHKILVEGVETDAQLKLMQQYKIDQVQGYHVGRPVPADRFRAIMATSAA